jgi:predicted TPR repeat methyltransferase
MKKQRSASATPNIFGQAAHAARPSHSSEVERQIALTYFNSQRFAEAEQYSRNLVALYPNDAFGWGMLGAALHKLGQIPASLEPMQKAALLNPQDAQAFHNLGSTQKLLGQDDYAQACYERVLELNPNHVESLGSLAGLLHDNGRKADALLLFQRKAALQPEDGYTAHMVATLSGTQNTHMPDQYVSRVFDGYADRFESHLTQELQYRTPELVMAALAEILPFAPHQWDVLDLGCGTGLAGAAIAPQARSLVGVDLSGGMLAHAKARGIYHQLIQSDLLSALKAQADASQDIVLAADVFVYVGPVEEVMTEIRRVLRPGGHFGFSVELLPESAGMPLKLESTGRYSHANSHLVQLAAQSGFRIVVDNNIVLRLDNNKVPIPGKLSIWS